MNYVQMKNHESKSGQNWREFCEIVKGEISGVELK
jgi:hypothetical protein